MQCYYLLLCVEWTFHDQKDPGGGFQNSEKSLVASPREGGEETHNNINNSGSKLWGRIEALPLVGLVTLRVVW